MLRSCVAVPRRWSIAPLLCSALVGGASSPPPPHLATCSHMLLRLVLLLMAAAASATAGPTPRAAVIFLHGSGDDGAGLQGHLRRMRGGRFLREMEGLGVRLLFPSATPRPYTLAGGQVMSVWFDRYDLPPTAQEHTASVLESCAQIDALVQVCAAPAV